MAQLIITTTTVPNPDCDEYSFEATKASPHSDSQVATNGLGEELARGLAEV
ncbi:major facilitator superfamily transporter [Aspergillus luchuensis]|uniref:Major facilitator superfamily transporter n=1 Tax=Aspergillus kawachii TaxID=1069201 RepID=A0A146FAP1_ASPKA|nr:major facilitator superfamily transporter [Aspergillus luchuensis]